MSTNATRCQDCRRWLNPAETRAIAPAAPPLFGSCTRAVSETGSAIDVESLAVAIAAIPRTPVPQAVLLTAPEFGCNQASAREQERAA